MSNLTRRKFLYGSAAIAAGTVALGTDGFVESNDPHIVRVQIPLARLPQAFDGFTIVHLSDFHYEEHFSSVPIRKAVDVVNTLRPDLVVLTGDFVTVPMLQSKFSLRKASETAIPCAESLSKIQARKIAILGNHDAAAYPEKIIGALTGHGIPVLLNASTPIEKGSARIWVAGIDDALRGQPDLGLTLEKIPRNEATILLAHEPDFADEASLQTVDLQLSGHSHGGQIWIPGIGAPWLPPMARKYPRGIRRIGNMTLYTNIGIGTIRAPIRINCKPEITLITLRVARN